MVPGMMLVVGGQTHLKKEEIKINFLIYKEEEVQMYHMARQNFRMRLEASIMFD